MIGAIGPAFAMRGAWWTGGLVSLAVLAGCRSRSPLAEWSSERVVGCWSLANDSALAGDSIARRAFLRFQLDSSATPGHPEIRRARLGIPIDTGSTAFWTMDPRTQRIAVVYSSRDGSRSLVLAPRYGVRDTLQGLGSFASQGTEQPLGLVRVGRSPCAPGAR